MVIIRFFQRHFMTIDEIFSGKTREVGKNPYAKDLEEFVEKFSAKDYDYGVY